MISPFPELQKFESTHWNPRPWGIRVTIGEVRVVRSYVRHALLYTAQVRLERVTDLTNEHAPAP